MGLDMYLKAKTYINKIDYNAKGDSDAWVTIEQFDKVVTEAGLEAVHTDIYGVEVSVTCAYWRKVNAVHGWFVQNVQNGIDDCGNYYVPRAKLEELREACRQAIFTKNPLLIKPMEGFFFGTTDIDEWYWNGLKSTIKQIDRILALPNFDELDFYYQSSW
jgi:hypothetical protein